MKAFAPALLAASALLALGGCATAGTGAGGKAAALPEPLPAKPQLAGMQYLYGSAESAAISRQAWTALVGYVAMMQGGKDRRGVVLAEDATLDAPKFLPCAGKPPAVVFDVDETVLLNQGFEYDDLTGKPGRDFEDRWTRWEQTGVGRASPVPGAKEGIDTLRRMGVAVIFNTNRNAFDAAYSEKAIDGAGLGPAVHGRTLYLAGDDQMGSRKDGRRWTISKSYCVIAMGGDQLGDFSDLFNEALSVPERRADTAKAGIADMWGHGWFVLPNPVYGTALQGGPDDIFPADRRWSDPAAAAPTTPR